MLPLSDNRRKILLSEDNSKPNKLWLAIAWSHDGHYIGWQWQGVEKLSRLQFRFEENGPWLTAKSHEEDVMPKMKFVMNKKNKEDVKKEK